MKITAGIWQKAAAALLMLVASSSFASAQVTEITIVHSGGKFGESMEACCVKPFTERTGVRVVAETPGGFGKLRAMVEAGNVYASLYDLSGTGVEQARALDLIEPLDWDAINPQGIYDEARLPDAFGVQYYSTIMAWRSDAKAPTTWRDFWNTEDFPGQRALPNYPYHILQIALLADGVPADELYPLDLDRAFASLERIKDHVSVWWEAGAQPTQLLKDNEVQYAVAWSGRVAGEFGLSYSFNEGVLNLSYFVVPRGINPAEKAAAMELLHELSVAENQALAATIISYTGSNPALDPLLPQDRLHEFPTSAQNKAVQNLPDLQWWYENADEVEKRWLEFRLGQ